MKTTKRTSKTKTTKRTKSPHKQDTVVSAYTDKIPLTARANAIATIFNHFPRTGLKLYVTNKNKNKLIEVNSVISVIESRENKKIIGVAFTADI